ncbi:unnamed protein product, partial [Owenia fusiformis]
MAIEDAKKMQLLPNYNLSVTWRNGACNAGRALGMAVDMITNDNIDTIIGPACSEAAIVVCHLATFWNFPVFSHGSSDPELADKKLFQTLVRILPPFSKMGRAFVEVFKYFKWNTGVLMATENIGQYSFNDYASRSIEQEFRNAGLTLSDNVKVSPDITENEIDTYLKRFSRRGRIIMLQMNRRNIRTVMER